MIAPDESAYVTIAATVNNGVGDSVTVELGTVPVWSLPLTADWKRTYRPVALELAAATIPLPSCGVRVTFTPHPETGAETKH